MAVTPRAEPDAIELDLDLPAPTEREATGVRRTVRAPLKLRLHQLDVLRGLCALMLVLYHAEFQYPGRELSVLRNGPLFVDFFFVLSGFIMLHNYRTLDTAGDVSRFMTRRFFRIYPLHVAMLGGFLAYELAQYLLVQMLGLHTVTQPFASVELTDVLTHLTLTNGLGLRPLSFNVPAWSISVEFWTYGLFAACVWSFGSRARTLQAVFVAGVIAAACVFSLQREPRLTLMNDHFLARCIFGYFLGALLRSMVGVPSPETSESSALGSVAQVSSIGLALGLLGGVHDGTRWLELLAPPAFTLVIACFVLWPNTPLVRALNARGCLLLGKLSYSIYMVHLLVLLVVQAVLRLVLHAPVEGDVIQLSSGLGAGALAAYVGIVIVVSTFTYRFIEDPGRRLGRELLSRSAPLVSSVAADP